MSNGGWKEVGRLTITKSGKMLMIAIGGQPLYFVFINEVQELLAQGTEVAKIRQPPPKPADGLGQSGLGE